MILTERYTDVIDQSSELEQLHTLKNFPVFMGCTERPSEEDILSDMSWDISKKTGVLQLRELIPLEVLYQSQHAGAVGILWKQHHQEFAKFLYTYHLKSVLEIGGAHGILSREYEKLDPIKWTILEPNPSPAEGVTARFIKGFFDDSFQPDEPVDTVVHSHVFEHVYEPDQFVKHLASFLRDGQQLIFTLPNMVEMLKRKYTNCINFEHTVFLTEPYVEYLLSKHGFRLVEKQYFLEDHSIFYAYVRDSNAAVIALPGGMYEYNKKLYLDYVQYHEQLIQDLNEKINDQLKDRSLYLFGAHVFAQYLIQFGLNTEKIVCLLDNDPNKQGKRLYGTSLQVAPPKILSSVTNPVVILKAGVYNQEIKSDILNNINSDTIFWE